MSIRLNSRCLDILSLLVTSEKPLPASEIAKQLAISSRMVRSSLDLSEQWLLDQNIRLRKVPGEGISFVGSGEARRNLARLIREYDQPLPSLSPSQRLQVLLLFLLFTDQPQQIKQLQQILYLSRSSTIGVINSAEKWLMDYKLELLRRPNFGFMIIGDEYDWREAVVSLLLENSEDAVLFALFQGNKSVVDIPWRIKTGLEKALVEVWSKLDVSLVKTLIKPIAFSLDTPLSDYAYLEFCFYLAIAIYRSRKGKCIGTLPDILENRFGNQQISIAKQFTSRIQKQFGVQLSEDEVAWIALKMPDTISLDTASDGFNKNTITESSPSIRDSVDRILTQASLSLHPSLGVDRDLIRSLSTYLASIQTLQQRGYRSRSSFLQELKNRYPYVYSVAMQSCISVPDVLGRQLNEAEIGEITLCLIAAMERLRLFDKVAKKVLVVCSAGMATGWLLVSRLRAEFPEIEVVDVISVLELENRKNFEGIDFIVGTVPIKVKNILSRQVNPLLGVDDIKVLKELFEEKPRPTVGNRLLYLSNIHLSDLLTAETVHLGLVAENWQEVVEKAGAKLVELGAIETRFVNAMKEIILDYGPYMVIWPGVVLLHAPPRGVRRLCMELVNLKTPVPFGHLENDPVKIAIVLGAIDNHSHINALMELNQVMKDEKARSAIGNTLHKSVVLHWISRYSNSS